MKKSTKKSWKIAGQVWLRIVVSTVMCCVLYLSMSVLSGGLLSRTIGYRIAAVNESGETTLVEEHYFTDGETEASIPAAGEGQTVLEITELPHGVKVVVDILTTVMMLFLLGVFPYNLLWELGGKDETKVRYKGRKPDSWRGFRIGWMATIPAALLYVALWVVRFAGNGGLYLAIYRVLQMPYLPFINALIGNTANPADVAVWKLAICAVTLLFIPVVCGLSYWLGFRRFSIAEHLTYKKTSDSTGAEDEEI